MAQSITTLGTFRILVTEDKGIYTIEILSLRQGIVWSCTDGMSNMEEAIELAREHLLQIIDNNIGVNQTVQAIHEGMVVATELTNNNTYEYVVLDTEGFVYGRYSLTELTTYAMNRQYTSWSKFINAESIHHA